MKDRALRRHQDFKVRAKKQHEYKACIGEFPDAGDPHLENNIEKLKKVCVSSHSEDHTKKEKRKSIQEQKHDITMREQLRS